MFDEEARDSPWRLVRFVFERLVRVGVWVVTLSVVHLVFAPDRLTALRFAAVVAVSVAAWTPTTVLRFRSAFFPGEPHPRLRDADGQGWNFRDVVVVLRCGLAEQFLSALPWFFIAAYATLRADLLGAAMAVVMTAVVGWGLWRHLVRVEGEVARLESAVGFTRSARRRLERLLKIRFGTAADPLRHSLASARFRDGDVPGALEVLDQIREPERWYVVPLRAQMLVASDPEAARAVVGAHDLAGGEATMILWLADLHEGHPERVRAAGADVQELLESAAPDVVGMLQLLLAAAWASVDAPRAVAYLEAAGWSREELPWLSQVWPAVGEPVATLSWREPEGEQPMHGEPR